MKFWMMTIIVLFSTFVYAEDAMFDVKAPFKEGTIYYEMKGNTQGSEILYIKDWGRTTASYKSTTTKIWGIVNQEKTITINTPKWDYDFDMVKKIGTKQRSDISYMQEEYDKLSAADKKKFNKNAEEMGFSVFETFNGKIEKNAEKILGFNCDKATMTGVVVYTIHNSSIPLKTVSNIMGMKMEITAVKIDKNKIDDAKFSFPKDIIPDYDSQKDEMIKEAARQNVQMILSGEFQVAPVQPKNSKEVEKEEDSKDDFKDAMKKLNNLFGN